MDYLAKDNPASYVPLTIITPRSRQDLEHAEFEVIDPGSPKGRHRPTTSPRSSIQMTLAFKASNPDSLGPYPWRSLSFERKVRDGPVANLDPTPPMPPANLVRCPRLSLLTRLLACKPRLRGRLKLTSPHFLHDAFAGGIVILRSKPYSSGRSLASCSLATLACDYRATLPFIPLTEVSSLERLFAGFEKACCKPDCFPTSPMFPSKALFLLILPKPGSFDSARSPRLSVVLTSAVEKARVCHVSCAFQSTLL